MSAATRGGGLAVTQLAARQYSQAAEQAALAAELDQSFEGWRRCRDLLDARRRASPPAGPALTGRAVTAMCERRQGHLEQAAAIVDSLVRLADAGTAEVYTLGFLAAYRAEEGDVGGALAWLDRAFQLSPTAFDFRFFDCGLFDRIREDPAFQRGLTGIMTRVSGRFN
ncbi:MAG: hypothetical protein R2882_00965 [Gemmatimonadales bacterium]